MHLKCALPIGLCLEIVFTGGGIFNSNKTYFELVVGRFSVPQVILDCKYQYRQVREPLGTDIGSRYRCRFSVPILVLGIIWFRSI